MSRNIKISFLAQGHVNQSIEIEDECKLSDEEIIAGLNSGGILTTIQEGHTLICFGLQSKMTVIGTIDNVDNNLEYTDFEVIETVFNLPD